MKDLNSQKILITGAAGFIGFNLVNTIVHSEYEVIGIDNINNYYDTNLKLDRLKELGIDCESIAEKKENKSLKFNNFRFFKLDIKDNQALAELFQIEKFDYVCHLAAQAGVRYSLLNPHSYVENNLIGFLIILEGCRDNGIKYLVYASSSSVYGLNEKIPFSVKDNVDHPISIYAATKKANELLAHSYSHLFKLPTTGLRFFTVYGPWGRPDMSPMIFVNSIINNIPLKIFNNGDLMRDFTYIDDIIEGIVRVIFTPSKPSKDWNPSSPNPAESSAPFKIYNIGNSHPVKLLDYIETFEKILNKSAIKELCPMQPGDVYGTYSDVFELKRDFDYCPNTKLEDGIKRFIDWHVSYYKI